VVAGSYVTSGDITRGARARLVRDGVVVYEGRIGSLRRFKEDARTVAAGYECGIGLENYQDIKEGDQIEDYEMVEIPR
jgi:translation initiation factor IF-2